MNSSRLIARTAVALEKLQCERKSTSRPEEVEGLEIKILELRAVRTFLLCSTLLTEDSNDILFSQKQMVIKEDKGRMRENLVSLLVRVEDVIHSILDDHIRSIRNNFYFGYDMKFCEEEMDKWYTSLSDYLKKYSTSPTANQIKAIMDSVLENLKDYLSPGRYSDIQLKEQLEALKKHITVMRNIICFCTLFCIETQEFQCLLTRIEPFAISAAHLTLGLFHVGGPKYLPKDDKTSMVSALLLKVNPVDNPLLHELYTLAPASLKHSRELCDSTLDLNDYPFIVKLENCIVFLSTLLESTKMSLKELQLYEQLRSLRALLRRQPDRFDGDDDMWDITAATVCGAGVRIFSLLRKDLVINHGLQCFQDNNEGIWEKVLEERGVGTLRFKLCETNVLGFLNFLLEDYLLEVNGSQVDSNTVSCVSEIRDNLLFLKSFLEKLVELRNQQEKLYQDVWHLALEVAYKIEFLIDQLVLGDILDSFSMSLQSITLDIMVLKKADFLNIFNDEGRQEIFEVEKITSPSIDKVQSMSSNSIADEVVGFESEQASIINRLMRGMKKLQVVAIVGMPGLGKTTLATKVFTDLSITHHFHVKAWCSISQVFDRRKILLELLNQIMTKLPDEYLTMNADDLSQELWRSLKKKRYLIFFDDVWDIEAFNCLRGSLPDDSYQSRILLTSRHSDVVPGDILGEDPLLLHHLSVDKSVELLQKKLFPAQACWPPALNELGMDIAVYCKGLPLTVVIIAGLLKATKQEDWKDVVRTLRSSSSSSISDVTDQCGSTIEVSYKHLPNHLKPCFLWFGAFPEDYEYSVKRMIWLWISEGLIQKNESKSLEDVARDYMNNLIARSLVMKGEARSVGGVKSCRIHDLLHDFCKRKANEEFFLHVLKGNGIIEQRELSFGELETLLIDETENLCSVELRNLRRLCIYSKPEHLKWKVFCPRLRSLLFFPSTERFQKVDLSYIFHMSKLLRVLGIDEVELTGGFPSEIGALVQLRYLAIQVGDDVDPAIGNLSNLETLILKANGDPIVSLPNTLWNLRKLKHLQLNEPKPASIELPIDDCNSSCNLLELQTLSTLFVTDLSVLKKQLMKFPNICQTKWMLDLDNDGSIDDNKDMDFSFLIKLESLSLYFYDGLSTLSPEWVFPENLKKLCIEIADFHNKIAKLPHLEVLKLISVSFGGDAWHVEEGEFPKLKFLMLRDLDLVNWTSDSDDVFPNLEKLVCQYCCALENIPECLENIATLETIEVENCPDDVVRLVKKVYEFHKEELGNSDLQFHERGTFQKQKSGPENEFCDDEQNSTGPENEFCDDEQNSTKPRDQLWHNAFPDLRLYLH